MDETDAQKKLVERKEHLPEGAINRRAFLQTVEILGISVGVGEMLAACGLRPTATPYPTAFNPADNNPAYDPTLIAIGQGTRMPGAPSAPAGEAAPALATTSPKKISKKISWMCVSCGQRLPTAEALKTHALEMHSKRLPEIRRVEKPTYSEFLVGQVERFDERNTAFSRTAWDEEYLAKFKQAIAKGMAKAAQFSPEEQWAAFEGHALVAGSIYVDDAVGSLDESYSGYNGHMKDVGGLYGWDDPVNPAQFPVSDPTWMSERIKTVAKFYGADLVGITKVNPLWVYSNYFDSASGKSGPIEMPYPYAIVMGIEMSWDEINKSPRYEASAATALGYSRMAELSASLAKYIRALGYPALSCGNDTAQSIPLAIDAGLGEHGRNGLLLTPEFGPRQRLCKVFTRLPLLPDQPVDFGSGSYCEKCHACSSSCPARAIPTGDRTIEPTSVSNRPGIKRWTVNVSNCLLFWQENGGVDCSNCISSCPWALRSLRDWLET